MPMHANKMAKSGAAQRKKYLRAEKTRKRWKIEFHFRWCRSEIGISNYRVRVRMCERMSRCIRSLCIERTDRIQCIVCGCWVEFVVLIRASQLNTKFQCIGIMQSKIAHAYLKRQPLFACETDWSWLACCVRCAGELAGDLLHRVASSCCSIYSRRQM